MFVGNHHHNHVTKNHIKYQSASVLFTGYFRGKKYYYFGLENKGNNNGKLSTFGGGREKVDHKHPSLTAARETHEESHDVFMKKSKLIKRIHGKKKFGVKRIVNAKQHNITFIVPANTAKSNPMKKFKKVRKLHQKNEIKKIVAVSEKSLKAAIDNYKPKKNHMYLKGMPVRDCVAKTLKIARKSGKI